MYERTLKRTSLLYFERRNCELKFMEGLVFMKNSPKFTKCSWPFDKPKAWMGSVAHTSILPKDETLQTFKESLERLLLFDTTEHAHPLKS